MSKRTTTDEQARDSIAGLVNDPDLMGEACALFRGALNTDARCYVVGKVYEVDDGRCGCVTVLSEDVAGVIGHDFLPKAHEDINFALMSAYVEYRRFGAETGASDEALDDYLNFSLQKSFLPLFKNGVRARLIHPTIKAALPTAIFIIYLKYDEMYG